VFFLYGLFEFIQNPLAPLTVTVIEGDAEDLTRSTVMARLKTASLQTGNAARDTHLQAPDFLDAEHYPSLTFHSTSIEVLDATHARLFGDLTLRGVTREIALEHEESMYVLEGEIEVMLDRETTLVGPGDWVLIPIGVARTFRTVGECPARTISAMTPRRYLDYFDDVGREARTWFASLSAPPTPEQMQAFGTELEERLMPLYDTEMVN